MDTQNACVYGLGLIRSNSLGFRLMDTQNVCVYVFMGLSHRIVQSLGFRGMEFRAQSRMSSWTYLIDPDRIPCMVVRKMWRPAEIALRPRAEYQKASNSRTSALNQFQIRSAFGSRHQEASRTNQDQKCKYLRTEVRIWWKNLSSRPPLPRTNLPTVDATPSGWLSTE